MANGLGRAYQVLRILGHTITAVAVRAGGVVVVRSDSYFTSFSEHESLHTTTPPLRLVQLLRVLHTAGSRTVDAPSKSKRFEEGAPRAPVPEVRNSSTSDTSRWWCGGT